MTTSFSSAGTCTPGCGKGNHFGHSGKGCGMHITIWSDKILVQGRNYETGEWLPKYVCLVDLRPDGDDDGPVTPLEQEKDADATPAQ